MVGNQQGTATLITQSIGQHLDKWMNARKIDLLQNYEAKGLKASGKFADSLVIESREDGSRMLGAGHTFQMVNGRNPNANQDKEALRRWVGWAGSTILSKWVQDKGINANPYAIAWDIARQGTTVPNTHNDGKLLTDTFTQERYDELNKGILDIFSTQIVSTIQKTWQ